ncbi:hypothetical protein M427DRAFT_61883 [Gonapodya prolifera JEL478]|uniref:Uncharacterized protein n=1 Tax=Gonapodya prolifera (strain JEL478) TaxID=1344416 RepID=A0A139A1V8_GONPJ|nr:hypothetical protein M427DRAFT_61883 [Gonapodya prolifera JEL478]|eukprot:KXS10679.1 hypothetical protein M427DRAFT_61883 [Gonapodya prolifera JEL478]
MKTVQVQELKNFLVGVPESTDAAPPPGGPTSPVISSAAASGTSIPPVLEMIPACRWGIGAVFRLSWRQGDDERKNPPVRQNSRFRLCHEATKTIPCLQRGKTLKGSKSRNRNPRETSKVRW